MKKLLFTLVLVLLTAGVTMAAQRTLPPEIIITPGDDFYTIDAIGEGEIHLFCTHKDINTGERQEEEVESHYVIQRTDRPQCVMFYAYAQAAGKEQSATVEEYGEFDGFIVIPQKGIEIPDAPEITFTLDDYGCTVQAYCADYGTTYLFKKDASGFWEQADNYEGYMYISREDYELPLHFKAYSMTLGESEYYNEDNELEYFGYEYRSYETRLDYLLPANMFSPHGEIIFGEHSDDGKLPITYTGTENVTIMVTINGNPVELIDGKVQLVPGENVVAVTVSAEGYQQPLYAEYAVIWSPSTPEPQIIVTPGELAYTVQAVGQGEVHLYCEEHYCEYHQFGGEMENPFTISRTGYDEIFHCYATATLGDGYEPAFVALEVLVPALGQTPKPTITFTEDETGCEVRAVGEGEVHLYLGGRYNGQEVQNPYRISRPYEKNSFSFEAYAQVEGQWESETVRNTIEVSYSPSIWSNEIHPSIYYEEVYIPDYEVQASGQGDVRLFLNGVEVENPYTVQTMLIDETCKFTATAKQAGKLTADSYETVEISPGPKRERLVKISNDDDNYYVTATGDGYITLDVGLSNDYYYSSYSADGECEATVTIPRTGLVEWKYVAKRYKDGNLLGFEVGSFLEVFKELIASGPYIFDWPGPDQYKVVAKPRYLLWIDSGDHIQLQYGTELKLNGQIVDEPYYVDREERAKSYDFSAVTTLQYERYEYLGIIDGLPTYSSEPLETVQVFSDETKSTVNVRQGGDNFYYEHQDYEYNEATGQEIYLLKYEVNMKKNSIPDAELYPDHAVVHANRDYSGIAVIRDVIKAEWYDIGDGEPTYEYYFNGIGGVGELLSVSWDGSSLWECSCVGSCPVTGIADNAFYGNLSLTGVEIGKNVRTIGVDAFKGCVNLGSVTCWAANPPTMTNMATFNNECYSNATLRVPKSSVEKYKTADWWRLFQHIEGVDAPGVPGDINGDGSVNISDVNLVIDAILTGRFFNDADINSDGSINISDINMLINMILSGN